MQFNFKSFKSVAATLEKGLLPKDLSLVVSETGLWLGKSQGIFFIEMCGNPVPKKYILYFCLMFFSFSFVGHDTCVDILLEVGK